MRLRLEGAASVGRARPRTRIAERTSLSMARRDRFKGWSGTVGNLSALALTGGTYDWLGGAQINNSGAVVFSAATASVSSGIWSSSGRHPPRGLTLFSL